MKHKIILTLLSLFVILFAYFSFDGFHFYDDTGYIEKAYFLRQQSLENILNNSNEQAHRFGFLLPLAAFQTLFPFHEITHVIWILICTLAGIYIVYHCLSSYCKNLALYASLLLGLDYYYLYLCNKVYPDTQTAIFCLLSAVIYWKNSANISNKITTKITNKIINSLINSFLFASAIFVALLCKLTAIFVLPFYFFLFVKSLFNSLSTSKNLLGGFEPPNRYLSLRFWFQSICFGLLFLFAYLAVYQYLTGYFLFRFHLVEANRYADALSYFDKSFDKLLIRLTYEPILMFLKAGYFVNFWLAIPIIFSVAADFSPQKTLCGQEFYCGLKSAATDKMKLWVHLLISMLAFYWFGSTSLTVYSPIPLDYRMFVIISPIMAIVAALGLQQSFSNKNYQTIYSIGFVVAALISKFYLHSPNYLIYSLLAILFLCMKYQKTFENFFDFQSKKTFQKQKSFFTFQKFHFYLILLVIILLIHPCYTLLQSNSANYFSEKHLMKHIIKTISTKQNKQIIVYTDSRLAESAAFYYEFQIPKNLKFIAFDTLKEIPKQALTLSDTITYLVVNRKTIKYLQDYTGKKFSNNLQTNSQNMPINYKILYDKNEVVLKGQLPLGE